MTTEKFPLVYLHGGPDARPVGYMKKEGTLYKIPSPPGGKDSSWDLSSVPYDELLAALRKSKSTLKDKQSLMMHHAMGLLDLLYPDWDANEHMKATPKRWVDSMTELLTPDQFTFTTFPATSDEMVVCSPIPFYTMCAHHVIPFYGKAHIGYVPRDLIAGLSKFGRLVQQVARGLWVQEELTAAIADKLQQYLSPRGVAVMLEGEHMCMSMRGVQMPGVVTTTSAMRGVFGDHDRTAKAEFLEHIRRQNV